MVGRLNPSGSGVWLMGFPNRLARLSALDALFPQIAEWDW